MYSRWVIVVPKETSCLPHVALAQYILLAWPDDGRGLTLRSRRDEGGQVRQELQFTAKGGLIPSFLGLRARHGLRGRYCDDRRSWRESRNDIQSWYIPIMI